MLCHAMQTRITIPRELVDAADLEALEEIRRLRLS
jgi:hypothetical protein